MQENTMQKHFLCSSLSSFESKLFYARMNTDRRINLIFLRENERMKLDISYFLSSKHARWLIIVLISLFSLLTLYEISKLFRSFENKEASDDDEQVFVQAPKNSLEALLNSSLFGVYVPNDLTGDNVKKSMLNITLVGILLGNNVENSQVIIRSANGEEKNYKVNDKIPGGALVKKIMAGGILVEHNGSLESVSLPKNELIFEPVAKPLRNED